MSPKRMNSVLKAMFVLLVMAVIAGLYFANQKLTTTAKETARLKAQIAVEEKQLDVYQLTKIKVDSLGYVDELAEKVLPPSEEQSVIVAELSQFALRANLGVAKIEFPDAPAAKNTSDKTKKTAIPKGVKAVPIQVQLKDGARYESILAFLRAVEDNRRKMQITNIALTPDEEDRSRLNEVKVSINLYARDNKSGDDKQ